MRSLPLWLVMHAWDADKMRLLYLICDPASTLHLWQEAPWPFTDFLFTVLPREGTVGVPQKETPTQGASSIEWE